MESSHLWHSRGLVLGSIKLHLLLKLSGGQMNESKMKSLLDWDNCFLTGLFCTGSWKLA